MTADSDNVTGDSENHRGIGQLESERSVIFRRNDRSRSIGMGGQLGSEYALGGILVRYYLTLHDLDNLGRVVMLSPPNQGSEAADELQDLSLYKWLNGPAGQQLVTGPDGLPAQLGAVDFPLGIITGNRHAFFDGWLADLFPGQHDGKVSVKRAKVEGMSDFLVVPHSHPFIMDDDEVIAQSLYFLREGQFERTRNDAP